MILLLYQALVRQFDIMFIHNSIRDFYAVFLVLFLTTFRAVQVLITLKSRRPDYFKVKAFYKSKRNITVLWLNEWTSIVLFYAIVNQNLAEITIYTPLNLLGLLIDSYFLCLLYLCYTKGLNGEFGDRIIDGFSVNVLETVVNDNPTGDAVIAQTVKEVQAVPYVSNETPLPHVEITRIVDFTISCQDLSMTDQANN